MFKRYRDGGFDSHSLYCQCYRSVSLTQQSNCFFLASLYKYHVVAGIVWRRGEREREEAEIQRQVRNLLKMKENKKREEEKKEIVSFQTFDPSQLVAEWNYNTKRRTPNGGAHKEIIPFFITNA